MAYYIHPPAPGTEYGPCLTECYEDLCVSMRADSRQLCRICKKPIGYGNRVYFEEGRRIVHADCKEIEMGMKGVREV